MKKVAIIGTVGVPANYGGFETLTENLIDKLVHEEDYKFTVYCSSKDGKEKPSTYRGARLEYINLSANGVSSVLYDIISLFKAALNKNDVLLILGVSGCIFLPLLKRFYKGVAITNIDGLEWKREKWGWAAKKFLKFSERLAVKHSEIVVADNQEIKDYILAEYGRSSELIEYGADHTTSRNTASKSTLAPFDEGTYAIKVCRIEPENNLHIVLDAFSDSQSLPLVIVGNWGVSSYGKQLKEQYRHFDHIVLLDPIYDTDLLFSLRSNAALYVHGHSAGGTNPSLVEAMYLKLPIVAYDVAYNRQTTNNQAIYFKSTEELKSILNSYDQIDAQKIANDMKMIADAKYTWSRIAEMYKSLF